MNVSNCPRCGKIFHKTMKNLCPDCMREDEQMYEKVYRYLRDNPHSTVTQVSEVTEVSEDRVLAFLREGRIQSAEWTKLEYPCERCGSMIKNGRYCEDCSRQVQGSLKSMATQLRAASEASERREGQGYHSEERKRRGF